MSVQNYYYNQYFGNNAPSLATTDPFVGYVKRNQTNRRDNESASCPHVIPVLNLVESDDSDEQDNLKLTAKSTTSTTPTASMNGGTQKPRDFEPEPPVIPNDGKPSALKTDTLTIIH